jgi:hypothetical protein
MFTDAERFSVGRYEAAEKALQERTRKPRGE